MYKISQIPLIVYKTYTYRIIIIDENVFMKFTKKNV